MSRSYTLNVPSCGRAAAERVVRKKFPRVPLPVAVKILRDRRLRKSSRSSQKSQWKREVE